MQRYYTDFMLFQFHKGTIRTKPKVDSRTSIFIFQFHKGTIRTR